MTYGEAQERFIRAWEELSFSWGVSKSMAAVHAFLLSSSQPVCAHEIKEHLQMSNGGVSKNLNELLDWNLIYKNKIADKRKDYYSAEKDMWVVFKRIAAKRKQKELEPLLRILDELLNLEDTDKESAQFLSMLQELKQFSCSADSALDALIDSESNWIVNTWINMIRAES